MKNCKKTVSRTTLIKLNLHFHNGPKLTKKVYIGTKAVAKWLEYQMEDQKYAIPNQ